MVTYYDKNGVEIKPGMRLRSLLDGEIENVKTSPGGLCIVFSENCDLPPLRISLVAFVPDTALTGDNKLTCFEIVP